MKRDQNLERQVEEWFDAEARAMPQQVLEASLEQVARTRQVGQRRRPAWLTPRWTAPVAAAALLALVVVAGGLAVDRFGSLLASSSPAPSGSPPPVLRWDARHDLERWSNRLNPAPDAYGNADVWSYLLVDRTHSSATYLPLTQFDGQIWSDEAGQLSGYLGNGGIVLHPGVEVKYVALGWRSPIAGEVTITGYVGLVDLGCISVGSGIRLQIRQGSDELRAIRLDSGGADRFELTTRMSAGDSLYFMVDPGQDNLCDSTRLIVWIVATGE